MKDQKLYLIMFGGLGNQMFQYAAARSYQLERKCELILCDFLFAIDYAGIRSYSLRHCNLSAQVVLATQSENDAMEKVFRKQSNQNVGRIMRRVPDSIVRGYMKITAKRGWISPLLGAQSFEDFTEFHPKKNVMFGGFQSPKYFDKHKDTIRQELRMKCAASPSNAMLIQQMLQSESVAIHVRRGDYLAEEFQHLNVCTELYFKNAMEYLLGQLNSPVFYVFSNTSEDLHWIKEHFDLPGNIVYVDQNNDDYEELQLMYSCKHFIISNSTFSWWGQFLSDNPEKIVCAPLEWDKQTGKRARDIYEDSWILI